MPSLKPLIPLLLVLGAQSANSSPAKQQVNRNFYARPGVTPAEIIRARGFRAQEQFITTPDGYILKLTRATHPDQANGGLPNRAPILFLHGIAADPNNFLINSFNTEPKNLTAFNLRDDAARLAFEPSAKSLPFLAMNFGHEVWLLSRRGAPGSQRKVGNPNSLDPNLVRLDGVVPSQQTPLRRFSPQTFTTAPAALANYGRFFELLRLSFDPDFWNFSYDEQALYDIPQAIDYVLNQTRRAKLAIVAHSAGGALTLMSLSLYPELAERISAAVLWSPAYGMGNGDTASSLELLEPLLNTLVAAFPPLFSVLPLQAASGLFCATELTQRTVCESILNLAAGQSGGQEPAYPEFINTLNLPSSSHEYAQLLQTARSAGTIHKFDYGPVGNLLVYSQLVPPPYNTSNIRLANISFYTAATDQLVSPADVYETVRQFTGKFETSLVAASTTCGN